jgi:hypothetical protein
MNNKIIIGVIAVLVAIAAATTLYKSDSITVAPLDATPQPVTLSGTYTCLPHLDTTGPQTMECAFGIQTDAGEYYAVNFGPSADSMDQFQSGSHVRAEGNVVIKEALSSDHWQKYNMKGIFTVTNILESTPATPAASGKININAVCEGALAYMSFPDAAAAEAFVAECKEGKHPEVIDRYKTQLNLDGATI